MARLHDGPVDIDALRLALSIAEAPSHRVDGTHLIGALGRLARSLVDIGALSLVEKAETVACLECDDDHLASVTFDSALTAWTYFCPEAGRVAIDPLVLDIYELRLTWLLDWLGDVFRLPDIQRPIAWIDDRLWELGEASIGGQRLRLFFACGIRTAAVLEQMRARIDNLSANGKTGVVLTTSSGFSVPHRLPNGFSIVDINDVLVLSRTTVSIDRKRLLTLVEPEAMIDRYRTGSAGRPSSKDLYLGELKRRIDADEAFVDKEAEADFLRTWLARCHPDAIQPALKTIRNNIADLHRTYRVRKRYCPK